MLVCVFLVVLQVGLMIFKTQIHCFRWIHTDLCEKDETTSSEIVLKQSEELEKPKLVLFYTPLFGRTPWATIENDYQFNNWNNISCKVRNCRISYDKNDLSISDAVIFHGQDINVDLFKLSNTVKNRAKQRWVFYLHENPVSFTKDFKTLKNAFNWTMTYKLDSDIFAPYYYYHRKTGNNLGREDDNDFQNYAEGKDSLVAWMVSHCGKQRDKVVKKLMEYIPVHVYGACGPIFSQNRQCNKQDRNCLKILRKYKFYLAFENANCVDYISEKYWINSLQNNLVPVVLGGGNYTNKNLAIPGSFINVLDFKSIKDLADYLIMLDRNDTAYNEYFKWKQHYYVDFPSSWTCKLCSMLNNASLSTKWYNPQQWETFWGRKSNCGFLKEKVDKIILGNSV